MTTRLELALALFLTLLTVSRVHAQTPTPDPDTILQDCADTLPPDRPIPTGEEAPRIRIISPVSGTIIRSDEEQFVEVIFTVEVENFELADDYEQSEAGNHWHLWLNDGVWGMYGQTTVTSYIMYGTWRICASVGDAEHRDIGMPDAILLTVEQVADGEAQITIQPETSPVPVTALPPTIEAAPQTAASTPAEPAPSPVVIVGIGVVALGLGLWVGSRRARPRS